MLILINPSFAQVPDSPPEVRPIPAGPFLLYPLLSAEVEQTDNLFYSGVAPTESTTASLMPGLLARLPLGNSEMSLGYAGRYRDYGGAEIDDNFSHFFLAQGTLVFGNGLSVEFKEDYWRGVLDTQRFDPGGETTFIGDRFRSNFTEVSLSHDRGSRRRLGISLEHDTTDFDRNENKFCRDTEVSCEMDADCVGVSSPAICENASFFDSDSVDVGLYGQHRIGPRVQLLWDVRAGTEDLTRPEGDGEDRREEEGIEVRLGADMHLNPASSLRFSFGRSRDRFFVGDETSVSRQTVGTLSFTRSVPARPRFTANYRRAIFTSVFLSNAYYVSDSISARLESPSTGRVSMGVMLRYSINDYPQGRPAREDTILSGMAWVGYRLAGRVEWRFYGNLLSRSSDIPGVEYEVRRFGTSVRLGG